MFMRIIGVVSIQIGDAIWLQEDFLPWPAGGDIL